MHFTCGLRLAKFNHILTEFYLPFSFLLLLSICQPFFISIDKIKLIISNIPLCLANSDIYIGIMRVRNMSLFFVDSNTVCSSCIMCVCTLFADFSKYWLVIEVQIAKEKCDYWIYRTEQMKVISMQDVINLALNKLNSEV